MDIVRVVLVQGIINLIMLYFMITDKIKHKKEIKKLEEETKVIIKNNDEIIKNNQEMLKENIKTKLHKGEKITFPLKK